MSSRRRTGPGVARFLEWRIRFFGVGAVLGLAGIFFDEAWLVMAALAVLFAGVVLQLVPDGDAIQEEEGPEE